MDRFSKFHPIVSFSFFVCAILLTLLFSHPLYLLESFICAFLYSLKLKGKEAVNQLFKFILPLLFIIGIFNMIFCRYGETVLFSLKSYNFTLECLLYGLNTGLSLTAVIMWFDSYNNIITSEKFMSLFGKVFPKLSLLFCMILRFIPLMEKTAKEIKEAQIGLHNETKGLKNAISRFSVLISISLERSIETASAMDAKGYGKNKRKIYSRYKFCKTDLLWLTCILILCSILIAAKAMGYSSFLFNPALKSENFNLFSFLIYVLLLFFPLIVDFWEDVKWLYLKSKI